MSNRAVRYVSLMIALLAISDVPCLAQFTDDPHMGSALTGRADSVITTVSFYEISGGTPLKELLRKDVSVYNKKMQLVESYDCSYIPMQHTGIDSLPVNVVYTYDKEGNLIKRLRYFTTGQLWVKDDYLIHGLSITSRRYYCPDNSLTETDSLTIDVAGRMLKRNIYGKGTGLYIKSFFKYDENGNLSTENTYHDDGSLMFQRLCKYDKDGNIIEDYNPYGDRQDHTYTYEKYDSMHNWLTQIEYINNRAMRIQERRIYYSK